MEFIDSSGDDFSRTETRPCFPESSATSPTSVTAVALIAAAIFSPGGTAAADPSQDQKFFDLLGQKEIPPVDNANSLITTAKKACSKIDEGMPVGDLVELIRNNGFNENPLTRLQPQDRITRTIDQFINASVEAYCPYDRGKIASISGYRAPSLHLGSRCWCPTSNPATPEKSRRRSRCRYRRSPRRYPKKFRPRLNNRRRHRRAVFNPRRPRRRRNKPSRRPQRRRRPTPVRRPPPPRPEAAQRAETLRRARRRMPPRRRDTSGLRPVTR